MYIHESEYTFGSVVFHRASREDDPGIVVGVSFRENGCIYAVAWGDKTEKWHYAHELSATYDPIGVGQQIKHDGKA